MDKIFEKFFGRVVEGNRGEFFQSKTPKKNGTIKALVITLIFFLVAEYFTLLPINLRSVSYTHLYKDYIQDSYDKAAQIQAYRQNRPVELSELSKRVDGARDVIYKLYDNVHNLIVTAEMVEEAIVFGNRYRSTFLEVNTELTKAEVLFRNGEYTKALSTAVDIIEKIQPGSYEELIKKSSEKSV